MVSRGRADSRLKFDYNFLDAVHYDLSSRPTDPTGLRFNFIKTKEFGGTDELYVNGQKVDEIDMPQMHIATWPMARR